MQVKTYNIWKILRQNNQAEFVKARAAFFIRIHSGRWNLYEKQVDGLETWLSSERRPQLLIVTPFPASCCKAEVEFEMLYSKRNEWRRSLTGNTILKLGKAAEIAGKWREKGNRGRIEEEQRGLQNYFGRLLQSRCRRICIFIT